MGVRLGLKLFVTRVEGCVDDGMNSIECTRHASGCQRSERSWRLTLFHKSGQTTKNLVESFGAGPHRENAALKKLLAGQVAPWGAKLAPTASACTNRCR